MKHARFLALLSSHLPVSQTDDGPVVHVQRADDMAPIIKIANKTKTPVCPQHVMPSQFNVSPVWLDLSALNQVRRYRHEEGLIHVEAGITMDQLSQVLDKHHHRLAHRYAATKNLLDILGEAPLSLSSSRYGPLRYSVTGLEAVTGDGQNIHYGGEVVKNVTGYDMNKLFIGSRHRYGIITSAILKMVPQPEMSRAFLFHVEALPQALDLIQALHRQLSDPEVLALFKTKTTFGWQILLVLSGYREVVSTQSNWVQSIVNHLNNDLQELFLAPKVLDQWVQRLDWCHPDEPEALVVNIALPYKEMLDLPYRFSSQPWLKAADMVYPVSSNQMHLRWISVQMPQLDELQALKAQIAEMGGFLEVLRLPGALNAAWLSLNRPAQQVLQTWEARLKQQFDPHGILPNSLCDTPAMPAEEARR